MKQPPRIHCGSLTRTALGREPGVSVGPGGVSQTWRLLGVGISPLTSGNFVDFWVGREGQPAIRQLRPCEEAVAMINVDRV